MRRDWRPENIIVLISVFTSMIDMNCVDYIGTKWGYIKGLRKGQ